MPTVASDSRSQYQCGLWRRTLTRHTKHCVQYCVEMELIWRIPNTLSSCGAASSTPNNNVPANIEPRRLFQQHHHHHSHGPNHNYPAGAPAPIEFPPSTHYVVSVCGKVVSYLSLKRPNVFLTLLSFRNTTINLHLIMRLYLFHKQ